MKKKKLLLPLAVTTLSCGLCAGILTGCGGGHEHSYSEWGSDETGHWQICVEDNETTEKEPHVWREDDTCECGAEKPAYGTASGNVKLLKLGENVTDYAGVTIDSGEDDGIEIDYNSQTGAFTVTNARVGNIYKFSISKAGYLTTYVNMQAVKNQNVALGDCVLQYDAFTHGSHTGSDWNGSYGNPSKIDKLHVNDAENAHFTIGEGTGDFYVYSKESYGSVSASVTYKENVTWGVDDTERGNQGLRLVFEDGKAVMIRIEKMSDGKFKAQWIGGNDWEETPILNNWDFGSGEAYFNPFSAEAETQYKETGIELKLVRNGGVVRAYVNGQFMGEQILPEEYATQKCRVALAAAHVNGGVKIPFSISQTLPEVEFDSALTLETGTLPQGVEVSLDKTEGYKLGDLVTLSVNLPEQGDFMIGTINLGDTSLFDRLAEGKVSFMLTEQTNVLTVAVKQIEYANLTDVAVTGKKYDVTGNSLADGTTVTLKGQGGLEDVEITVTNGTFSKENVAQGTYTAELTGYKPATVVVGADGIPNGITLEYDGFTFLENFDTNVHDFTNANAENSSVQLTGNGTLNILTKDSFTDVAVSLRIKYNNSSNGMRTQGIVLKFEDGKHVIVRYHNGDQPNGNIQYVNNAWNGCPEGNSLFGADAGLNQWGEAPIHTLLDDETTAIKADGLYLTCVLKDGKLYTFFNEKWVATYNLPNGYDGKNVQIGFFTWDMVANSVAEFKITETLPSISSAVELTKNIPEGAEGVEVTIDKTSCALGDRVTLTVTLPESGYVVSEITLNGQSVLSQLNNGSFTFAATQAQNAVVVTVLENRQADIDVAVTGKKYDVTGNSIKDGTQVTLKGLGGLEDVTITVAGGKLLQENVAQGNYTAQVAGYKPVNVTVGANGIETPIVFEYEDAFDLVQGWGSKNLDRQNDGYLKGGNEMESLLTKALYNNVAFTVYLSGAYGDGKIDGGNQGIAFRFDGGGYVLIRMEGKQKVQFAKPEIWWQVDDAAEGADWNDLIFFQDSDEYLRAYAEGALKLTLVREGATFYAFLNDKYIGRQAVNSKYENVGAHVGIYWSGTDNGAEKTWKFEMSETLPNLSASVTTGTTANGTVVLSTATPKYGDAVTVTLTPAEGYILKSLTVGGKDVTNSVTFNENKVGTYTFTVTADAEIVAEFEAATYGNIETTISGLKGTEAIVLNGTKVTLTNAKAEYEYTIADGKLTLNNVLTGTYMLTADGYVSQTVTVTDSGIADAIVLVYNIFASAPDSADLTKLGEGKVTATGNGGVDLETKEKYTDVTVEAHFDVPDYNSRRYSVALVFGDGKNFRVDFAVQDNGNNILQQTNWESMMFNWERVDFPEEYFAAGTNNYTEEEIKSEFIAKGLTYKLERSGATVKLFINNVLMKTYTLPDDYKDQEAQLKFIFDSNGTDGTKGFTFDITVPETGGGEA